MIEFFGFISLSVADIDECKEGSSTCSKFETCQNTVGSFICLKKTCDAGFELESENGNCVGLYELCFDVKFKPESLCGDI